MMNKSVLHGRVHGAMPDFEELVKLTEDCSEGQIRGQELAEAREIPSRVDKRDAVPTKRYVQGLLSRRWSRRMNLDETYRAPHLFTWRY